MAVSELQMMDLGLILFYFILNLDKKCDGHTIHKI